MTLETDKKKRKKPAHLTRKHQKHARRAVSSESCAANGRKGAAATAAKYGYEALFLKSRRHRLLNPSRWELLLIACLSRCGLKGNDYRREERLGTSMLTVDFYFSTQRAAIEVRGEIHHRADAPGQEARQKNWVRKLEWLAEQNVRLLIVEYWELKDDALTATVARLRAFLQTG